MLILRFGGRLMPAEARNTDAVLASTSVYVAEGIILAEPTVGSRDLSDFLNHSCDPNAGLSDSISVVALRDLNPGEEIRVDYAFWEGDPNWKLRTSCRCGTTVCRITIDGMHWKVIDPASPRVQHFSPFLQRRIAARRTR